MGFIKKASLFILSLFLFITLLASSIFLTLSLSLKYENVEKEIFNITKNYVTNENLTPFLGGYKSLGNEFEQIKKDISTYCENNSEYIIFTSEHNFSLNCSVIKAADKNQDILIEEFSSKITREFYYRNYEECNFLDCIIQKNLSSYDTISFSSIMPNNPLLILVSNKARHYWQNIFYYSLIILIVLLLLIFLFVEKKQNALMTFGVLMLISSIMLLKLKTILLEGILKEYALFFGLFFTKMPLVSRILQISGAILSLTGILISVIYKKAKTKDITEKSKLNIKGLE
ncbi:MAG: hypothetical protein QXU40_02815 [Candidatus Pacearchaeota archaeon]